MHECNIISEVYVSKQIIPVIAIVMLLVTACAAVPQAEKETVPEVVTEQTPEVLEETAEEVSGETEEAFLPELPIHQGIWEARAYDQAYRYYEFDVEMDGRSIGAEEADAVAFTYEDGGNGQIIFHTESGDETAQYSFGEDGKHLVLTFADRQEELAWISHGTLEDLGGLGIRVIAENITPEGCTLVLRQMGGYPEGEIKADSSFHLLCYDPLTDRWGWKEEIRTDEEPYLVEKGTATERVIDWSEEYGSLEPGRYYLYFRIRDIRNEGGDWDAYRYRAEIVVAEDGKKAVTGGFKTYYELPDGTWECDGYEYKYRLEISGRMSNAARDSTFIYLSNTEEITFHQAAMAAGLSSNMADYFSPEEAVFVDWIVE